MTQHHTVLSSSAASNPPAPSLPSLTTPTLNNIDACPHINHHTPSALASSTPALHMNGPTSSHPHGQAKQRVRARAVGSTGGGGGGGGTEDSSSDNDVVVSRNLRRRDLKGGLKPDPTTISSTTCTTTSTSLGHHNTVSSPTTTTGRTHKLNSIKLLAAADGGGGGGTNGGLKLALNGSPRRGPPATGVSESPGMGTYNHRKGPSDAEAAVRGDGDSPMLRSRSLRVKPYAINHKPAYKSS